MKKHLSLLLAVLMLLTSAGFNVIAAGEHVHQTDVNNPKYYNVVNPTCDTKGYTEYLCVTCGEVASVSNYTNALGHQYGEDKYEPVEGGYNKYQECTRQYTVGNELVSCKSRSYELEDGAKTLYKNIVFVNNKVTASYDESITYTKVAETFKNQQLHSYYLKKGEEVIYDGKINPYREKTVHYGKYDCIGWTTDASLEATAAKNLNDADCADLLTITDEVAERDIVLYPVFAGDIAKYMVVFYNLESNITWPQDVVHGSFPKYSFNGELYPAPTKPEDIRSYYQFNGWATKRNQTSGIPTVEIEKTPIYGDAHFYPSYKPVAKNYTLEFYDAAGENLIKYNGADAVFEGVNLGVNLSDSESPLYKDIYADIMNVSKTKFEKEGDKTYYYEWTGKWQVLRGDDTKGTTVNFTDFNVVSKDVITELDAEGNIVYLDGELPEGLVAEGQPNKEPSKIIRLVPVFDRRLHTYAVDVEMQIPYGEDSDYYRGGAEVTVIANNNQLVASGKTDADGKLRCWLNYQVPFTVTIATSDGKYLGTATISDLVKASNDAGSNDVEAEINKCRVEMKLNPEYETHCSCIHHSSLLQPLIVRIYNLLYTFFNVKYVCCYDMTSTIGPLLDYVDDNGNII